MSWKAWLMTIAGIVVLVPSGIGLYMVLPYLYYLGLVVMIEAGLLPTIGVVLLLAFTVKYITKWDFQAVEQFGGYFMRFGKREAAPPLSVVTPKVAGSTTVTEIQQDVPRLGELIDPMALLREGENGKMEMLQGVRQDASYRYGEWPGVIVTTGKQNVGKSITLVILIVIALLQGAKVVVCDTHWVKGRSLKKKIEALIPFITLATTEEAVLLETQKFSEELARRKTVDDEREHYPYVIFYDEFCSLLRSQKVQELQEVLPTALEEAGQEGHGFHMHFVASIHDLSDTGIGTARLRGFFNWVYCHRMDAQQAKFIESFKGRYGKQKTVTVISGLPAGHVIARDDGGDIEYLIMPFADSKDVLQVKKKLETMRLSPVSQLSLNEAKLLPSGETVNVVNELGKRWEDGEKTVSGETFTGVSPDFHGENSPVSPAEEGRFVDVLWRMQESGEKITRTNIQKNLGWNNRQYDKIKYLCEKHEVGKSEVVNA